MLLIYKIIRIIIILNVLLYLFIITKLYKIQKKIIIIYFIYSKEKYLQNIIKKVILVNNKIYTYKLLIQPKSSYSEDIIIYS